MKRKKSFVNLIILILPALLYSCQGRSPYNAQAFPLRNEYHWDFSGKYNQKAVSFRIEVRNVIRKKSLTFALMRGFPTDVMSGDDLGSIQLGIACCGE